MCVKTSSPEILSNHIFVSKGNSFVQNPADVRMSVSAAQWKIPREIACVSIGQERRICSSYSGIMLHYCAVVFKLSIYIIIIIIYFRQYIYIHTYIHVQCVHIVK